MTAFANRRISLLIVSIVTLIAGKHILMGAESAPAKPNVIERLVQANTRTEAREWQLALDVYDAVLAEDASNVTAKYGRAFSLEMLGRMADAIATYRELANMPTATRATVDEAARRIEVCCLPLLPLDFQKAFEMASDLLETTSTTPKVPVANVCRSIILLEDLRTAHPTYLPALRKLTTAYESIGAYRSSTFIYRDYFTQCKHLGIPECSDQLHARQRLSQLERSLGAESVPEIPDVQGNWSHRQVDVSNTPVFDADITFDGQRRGKLTMTRKQRADTSGTPIGPSTPNLPGRWWRYADQCILVWAENSTPWFDLLRLSDNGQSYLGTSSSLDPLKGQKK